MGGIQSYMSNYCIDDFSVYNEFINDDTFIPTLTKI